MGSCRKQSSVSLEFIRQGTLGSRGRVCAGGALTLPFGGQHCPSLVTLGCEEEGLAGSSRGHTSGSLSWPSVCFAGSHCPVVGEVRTESPNGVVVLPVAVKRSPRRGAGAAETWLCLRRRKIPEPVKTSLRMAGLGWSLGRSLQPNPSCDAVRGCGSLS